MARRSNVNRKEWSTTDYYEILGVDDFATPKAIEEAYFHWIKTSHPDQHSTVPSAKRKAEQDTKRLNAAFEVLHDKKLRKEYDQVRNRKHTEKVSQDAQTESPPSYPYQNPPRCNVRKAIGRPCANPGLSEYGGRCKRHAQSANRPKLQGIRTLLALAISLPLTAFLTLTLTNVESSLSVDESRSEESSFPAHTSPVEAPATFTEAQATPAPTPTPAVSTPEPLELQYRNEIISRLQALDSVSSPGNSSQLNATSIFFSALHDDLPQGQSSRVIDSYVHEARLELASRLISGATADWEEQTTKFLKSYYLNPRIILCCLTLSESLPTYTGVHIHLHQESTLDEVEYGPTLDSVSPQSDDLESPLQPELQLSQAISEFSIGDVFAHEDAVIGPVLFLISGIPTNQSTRDTFYTIAGCAFVPRHALADGYFATLQVYDPGIVDEMRIVLGTVQANPTELSDPPLLESSALCSNFLAMRCVLRFDYGSYFDTASRETTLEGRTGRMTWPPLF